MGVDCEGSGGVGFALVIMRLGGEVLDLLVVLYSGVRVRRHIFVGCGIRSALSPDND